MKAVNCEWGDFKIMAEQSVPATAGAQYQPKRDVLLAEVQPNATVVMDDRVLNEFLLGTTSGEVRGMAEQIRRARWGGA